MSPSYIDSNLQPGEKIVYRGRPSKSAALRRPAILLLVFVALDAIDHSLQKSMSTTVSHGAITGGEIVVGLLLVFDVFALVITTTAGIRFLMSAQYAVTDRRVVAKYGLIRRSSMDLLLTKVSGVTINQGILGRTFDFGNVLVQSSGVSRGLVLTKSPNALQSAILKQLDDSRLLKGTAAYPLDVKIVSPSPTQLAGTPAKPTTAPPLPPGTPAKWVRDPFDQGMMRYWDGDRWTDHTAPAP